MGTFFDTIGELLLEVETSRRETADYLQVAITTKVDELRTSARDLKGFCQSRPVVQAFKKKEKIEKNIMDYVVRNPSKVASARQDLEGAEVEVLRLTDEVRSRAREFEKDRVHVVSELLQQLFKRQLEFHASAMELYTELMDTVRSFNIDSEAQDAISRVEPWTRIVGFS